MEEKKRVRRTKEQLVADIDKKIAYHHEQIKRLEERKVQVLTPRVRKKSLSAKSILDYAKSNGMSLEDIAAKLGYNPNEQ